MSEHRVARRTLHPTMMVGAPALRGRDHPILVLVPDNHGRFEVAIGAVQLNRGKAPDRPSWVQRVLAG